MKNFKIELILNLLKPRAICIYMATTWCNVKKSLILPIQYTYVYHMILTTSYIHIYFCNQDRAGHSGRAVYGVGLRPLTC